MPYTILVVDDSEDSRELIRETLAPHHFEVVCAESGPQALQILRDMKPAVIILDILMPDMNGFALLDIIRDTPEYANIPVILQTADPSRKHGQRTVDSGLTYMLAKPLEVTLLVRAVQDCIRKANKGVHQ